MKAIEGRRADVRWYALSVIVALAYAGALIGVGHVEVSRLIGGSSGVPWSPFVWLGVAAAARLAVFAGLGVLLARHGWGWWSAAVAAVMAAAVWATDPGFMVHQLGFPVLERISWESVTGLAAVAVLAGSPALGALLIGRHSRLSHPPVRPVLVRSLPLALLVALLAAHEGSLDGPRERLFAGAGAIALVLAVGIVTLSPGNRVRAGLMLGVGAVGTTLAFYAENASNLSSQGVGYGLLLPLVVILGLGGWFMASPALWHWWQRGRHIGPSLSLHRH